MSCGDMSTGLKAELASAQAQAIAAEQDASRRLRERDEARGDIDALRNALGMKTGEGLTLAEITAHVRAMGVTGDHVEAGTLRVAVAVEDAETRLAEMAANLADSEACSDTLLLERNQARRRIYDLISERDLAWADKRRETERNSKLEVRIEELEGNVDRLRNALAALSDAAESARDWFKDTPMGDALDAADAILFLRASEDPT